MQQLNTLSWWAPIWFLLHHPADISSSLTSSMLIGEQITVPAGYCRMQFNSGFQVQGCRLVIVNGYFFLDNYCTTFNQKCLHKNKWDQHRISAFIKTSWIWRGVTPRRWWVFCTMYIIFFAKMVAKFECSNMFWFCYEQVAFFFVWVFFWYIL